MLIKLPTGDWVDTGCIKSIRPLPRTLDGAHTWRVVIDAVIGGVFMPYIVDFETPEAMEEFAEYIAARVSTALQSDS